MSFIPKIGSTGLTPYSSIPSTRQGAALKAFRMFGLALGGAMLFTTGLLYRANRAKANNEYTRWQRATSQYNADYSQWLKDAKLWVREVKGQTVRAKLNPPELPPFRG